MSGSRNSDAKEDDNAGLITAPAGHIPFEFEKNSSSDTKNNEDSSFHGFCDTDLKPSYFMEGEGGEEVMDVPYCALTARSYFLDMMRTMSESLSIGVCVCVCRVCVRIHVCAFVRTHGRGDMCACACVRIDICMPVSINGC